jgi:hypothetical protein
LTQRGASASADFSSTSSLMQVKQLGAGMSYSTIHNAQ